MINWSGDKYNLTIRKGNLIWSPAGNSRREKGETLKNNLVVAISLVTFELNLVTFDLIGVQVHVTICITHGETLKNYLVIAISLVPFDLKGVYF